MTSSIIHYIIMRIILDEREVSLFEKCKQMIENNTSFSSIQLSKKVLELGDILIKTDDDKLVLLIERKTFSDLVASIKDGRYEEQSYRLIYSTGYQPHSIMYLIEGNFAQLYNPVEKKIILSAMTTLNIFKGFSLYRTVNVSETAEWIVNMAKKIEKEMLVGKTPYYPIVTGPKVENEINITDIVTPPSYCTVAKKVKKENVTCENIGEIMLCQIPGISSVTAIAIMKKFSSFPHFMEEIKKNPACLTGIICETKGKTRKVSKACIESIKKYLIGET